MSTLDQTLSQSGIADGDIADVKVRWLLPVVMIVLVAANLGITFLPGFSVVIAIVVATVLVVIAKVAGHNAESLGLKLNKRSVIWAAGIGVAVWSSWLLIGWAATRFGFADALMQDDRNTGLSFQALLWSLLVVIPVGTVLLEEIGFRSVLMGEVQRLAHTKVKHPVFFAGLIVSILFGLWHIGPALAQANASDVSGPDRIVLIIGTVLFTAASGGLFAWLRWHTKSVVTPAVLHAAVNGAGLLVVWLLAQNLFA